LQRGSVARPSFHEDFVSGAGFGDPMDRYPCSLAVGIQVGGLGGEERGAAGGGVGCFDCVEAGVEGVR
jgi:hypothetical protein